jgi:nitrogen regulatory protein PII
MAIEIVIKPEDVDALVKDALMKASLGKLIADTIAAATKAGGYNNPVEHAVSAFLKAQVEEVLRTTYREQLRTAVVDALAKFLTDEWITQQAEKFASKLAESLRESRY